MEYVRLALSALNPGNVLNNNRHNRILKREVTALDREISETEEALEGYTIAISEGKGIPDPDAAKTRTRERNTS